MPTRTKTRRDVRWVGLSPDARKAERRTLLLDATFDLLGTEGAEATTVRAVCLKARLNPRYFYESFDDLDTLVVAVYDRVVEALAHEVLAAQAAAPDEPRAQLRSAIESSVRFVDEDRRRGKVLYVEALGNEALNRRRKEAGHTLVGLVEQAAAGKHGALPPGERIARIGAAILVGGVSELLVEWLEGRIDVTPEQLVDDATDLFLALGEATAAIAARRSRAAKPRKLR
jgi:AcrR family transcriptional regulator